MYHWNLHNFEPEDLLYARFDSPALKTLVAQLKEADGLIVATPVYKAAYSGALKTLLDLLPERALEGKVVLPLGDRRHRCTSARRRLRAETGAQRPEGAGDFTRRLCR